MKRVVRLPNGILLGMVTGSRCLYTGISIAVHGGSRYEDSGEQGLSHLVEHLMFHGCERYPERAALAEMLDRTVVDHDATTYATTVCISFETTRSSALAGIDLIAEIVLHPIITRSLVNREITRINDEEILDRDTVDPTVDEMIESLIFQGDVLAQSISGSPQRLLDLTVREIEEWHRTMVRGNRMAIAVVGNFNPLTAEKRVRQCFSRLPHGPLFARPRFSGVQSETRILLSRQATGLVQIRIGFPTVGFRDPDRLVVALLNNHLGAEVRWGSRLAERIYGGGLSYVTRSSLWHYDDVGTLTIVCAAPPGRLKEVLSALGDELRILRTQKLTHHAFDLTLVSLKRDARERLYTGISQARFYAHQLLATGDVMTSEQFAHELSALDPSDLLRVAAHTLAPHRMNVVLYGPVPIDVDEQTVQELLLGPSDGRESLRVVSGSPAPMPNMG